MLLKKSIYIVAVLNIRLLFFFFDHFGAVETSVKTTHIILILIIVHLQFVVYLIMWSFLNSQFLLSTRPHVKVLHCVHHWPTVFDCLLELNIRVFSLKTSALLPTESNIMRVIRMN